MRTSRRGVLIGGAAALGLTACGKSEPKAARKRVRYGKQQDQYGDLFLPDGDAIATVVTIHGGYWYDQYGLDLMNPIADAIVDGGGAVWNLEYRRIDGGGGWPTTFEDVAAGVDHLIELDGINTDKVIVLGHSAGGHLAAWAASRTAQTPGGASKVDFTGCVSLAGALDLTLGSQEHIGNDAVDKLMGGTAADHPDRYALGDPTLLVPAACPVSCFRGVDDTTVPKSQATSYVAAATEAGGKATLTEVPGDHFTLIEPKGRSWAAVTDQLLTYAR